jgi:hypothetical protein
VQLFRVDPQELRALVTVRSICLNPGETLANRDRRTPPAQAKAPTARGTVRKKVGAYGQLDSNSQ